jgi:glycosyltransferase involved in cell wall biosynthesis
MTSLQRKVIHQRIKEWLVFDCRATKAFIAVTGLAIGLSLILAGRALKGTSILAAIHRANLSESTDKIIEKYFARALSPEPTGIAQRIRDAIYSYPKNAPITKNIQRFLNNPETILNGCTLVLKSPSNNEKGVLYVYYSYLYPLLLRTFDAKKITEKYRLVLEPSWSGFCDLNILCTSQLQEDIVVGFGEPRDANFLKSASKNLIPGNFTGNTWIDTETFKPIENATKDIDVIVVASWAWYKRHWAIFRAIKTLRDEGYRLKIALVGYPVDMSMSELKELASNYGVLDQIEFHERVSTQEVNALLNRSKVNLLWSRREGTPRTIPEGMAAGVPAIMRSGFNYGAQYGHINEQTGVYADEKDLPAKILKFLSNSGKFNPRSWILENMTPEVSTNNLNETLRKISQDNGEEWSRQAEIKISTLDGLKYKNEENQRKYKTDNEFLKTCIRKSRSSAKLESIELSSRPM